jgi:dihydrolipoamide dehydrogenase
LIYLKIPDVDMTTTIFIGGGPAGRLGATAVRAMGGEPLIVEKMYLGGECANIRCVVEESMVEYAVNLEVARKIFNADIEPKFEQVLQGTKKMIENGREFLRLQSKSVGLEDVKGEAKLLDANTVEVEGEKFRADNIVIATGSRPQIPPIKGNDLEGAITYREVLDLDKLPKHLVIIGGGGIGASYGYAFNTFGSDVTILEQFQFLGQLDKDLRNYSCDQLQKRGIKIFENVKIEEIRGGEKVESVVADVKGEKKEFPADIVLFAVGLVPNSEIARDFVKIGVRNEIVVDKRMRTSIPNVYAAGDVIGPPYLTPVARREGAVAAANIMGRDVKMDYRLIPMAVLSNMEYSWVGMTEEAARKEYKNVSVLMIPPMAPYPVGNRSFWLANIDPALTGMLKIVVDKDSRKVLGAHLASYSGKNAMHYIAHLMKHGLTIDELSEIIEVYPDNDAFPVIAKMMLGSV